MTVLLRATNISKSFAGVQALRDVSFDLAQGEIHALVGENGAGKSTLIKIITGAVQRDAGSLEFSGEALDSLHPVASRRMGIAPIFQQPALFPDLTVAENIALALEPRGGWRIVHWRERRARARDLLTKLNYSIDPDAVVNTLTMPEQQLVEVARAVGANVRVLIMDEPTASLSQRETERLLTIVGELRGQGIGIIYIS